MNILLGDYERAEAAASESLALCEERGFAPLAAIGRTALGRAWTDRGRALDGFALMRRGLSELIAFDYWLPVPGLHYMLSEACNVDQRYDEAVQAAEIGLSFNPHELAYRPQGLTARGTARFELGQTDLAVRDFIEAIELAQRTHARMYELRAATGLARVLKAKAEPQAARDVLATIHASFEGRVGMIDVRRANELMKELDALDAGGSS